MPSVPPLWGFLGLFAGGWKLAIVAAVAVAFYGRTFRRYASLAKLAEHAGPRPTSASAPSAAPRRVWYHDRIFVFFLVIAATAVASLILARAGIMQSGSASADPESVSPPSSLTAPRPLEGARP